MSQLVLTRSPQFTRTLRTRNNFPLAVSAGKYFLMFSMMFLIGLLSFFYLVQFTEIHTKGYQLRKLEIEHNSLLNIRDTRTTDIARQRSLLGVRESSIATHMVPARTAIFIRNDGAVATTVTEF